MKRRIIAAVAVTLPLTAVLATAAAGPAAADQRRCFTPHVGPFPTVEQCIWLPDPGLRG
ncbi:MAG: hypothetical protein M3N21_08185 [Actinomycetota bacterium]|nr:hypothetical protein [Actinomycetota bacterium]